MAIAARVLRIRGGEGRLVALVLTLQLVSMAAFTMGESGIDALFFDRVGADALPLMYLLQGGTTFVVMLALTGALGRLGHRRAYLAAPLAIAGIVLAERGVLVTDARWIYPALWVTAAVATLVGSVWLWGTAGAVFDTRQAKRLFPIVAAGGILGSVLGGLVTRPLAPAIGAENLLLVWVGGLVVGFVISRVVLGPAPDRASRAPASRRTSPIRDLVSSFGYVRRSSLLRWMTAGAVLFSILFYSLYLPYARAASEHFPHADDLAGFFGLFWAAVTGAAFLASMFVANRLFAWFGIAAMILVLPVMYGAAFAVLLFVSGFAVLVSLRFTIGTWLQGVASPGWEAITNLVPESRRDQTRAFLNGGPTQIGTAIAGVVALVGQSVLTVRQFSAIGLVAAVLTVVAALGVRRSYLAALVDALRVGRPQVFEQPAARRAPLALALDADSTRVLTDSMRSTDVRERRLAFQLLGELPPEARPSEIATGLRDEDAIVRLAAVRALDVSTSAGLDALAPMIEDRDAVVAAAAAARTLTAGDDPAAEARLDRLLNAREDGSLPAVLEQLTLAPPERAAEFASPLLVDPDVEVRAKAVQLLCATAPDRAVEPALAGLRDPDPGVRAAAARALASAPDASLDHVLEALEDVRTADAAVEAIRSLEADTDGDRTRAFVRGAAARATSDRELAATIPRDDEPTRLLADALLERGRRSARAGLWAATLSSRRRADMQTAIENLDGPREQVATALEAIEAASDPALVRPLVALWESTTLPTSGDRWLSRALADEDDLIRRCAEFVRARREGGSVPTPTRAISTIERVLFLRKVPLFAELEPSDLDRVAQLAEERGYADAEVIAAQGEMGEDLFIVVDGTIRVVQDRPDGTQTEIARRATGEFVGEMSLLTRSPRMANLIADAPVRTIRLGRREFESMLRERPSVGLAVMRELAARLAASRPAGESELATRPG